MHMKNMTVGNIAKACGGKLFGDEKNNFEASCVVIDSRKMTMGVCLLPRRVNGRMDMISFHKWGKWVRWLLCAKENL